MIQRLQRIQEQIARLRQDEQRLKVEASEVVAKIRVAIEAYGFTPNDLFAKSTPSDHLYEGGQAQSSRSSAGEGRQMFSDGQGNVWKGLGPKPKWLKEALEQGRRLEDFATEKTPQAGIRANARKGATLSSFAATERRRVVAVKYRDGENAWSGRGSYPRWLKEAIENGRQIEEFRV